MENCFSDVAGGMTAVGGTAASTARSSQNDAVDLFLKNRGFHGGYSQIELSFSTTNLRDRDVFSKSDHMLVIYMKGRDGTPTEVFRTEVVLNSLNPTWITKYAVAFFFESVQTLLFRLFDVDTQFHNMDVKMLKLEEQQFLGEASCTLSEIVTKPNRLLTLSLVNRGGSSAPTNNQHRVELTVHAEELASSKNTIEMILSCSDLESKDLLSRIAYLRCHIAYSYYKSLQKAVIITQCGWMRRVARRELRKLKMGATSRGCGFHHAC